MLGLKHPSRHFIYFLISRRLYNAQGVIDALKEMGLPAPIKGTEELDHFVAGVLKVKKAMKFPVSFNPRDPEPNEETASFLSTWRIRDAWEGSEFLAQATFILSAPPIRFALELMLLGPMSVLAIANRLQQRYELPKHAMNAGVVRAYRHYFWDISALSPVQWKSFLELHYEEELAEFVSALQAPRSSAGAAYVLSIADKDPKLLDPASRYEVVAAMSFKAFMATACNPKSPNSTFALFAALNAMRVADMELDKYRGGSSEVLSMFDRLETVYDKSQPLTIAQHNFLRPVIDTTAEDEGEPENVGQQ